jgi:hypothetical protein
MVNWNGRPIKKFVRDYVATFSTKGKRHALFFPADHAKDALALKDAGVINGLTSLLAVEKSRANLTKAIRVLTRNKLGNCKGRETRYFDGLLHEMTGLTGDVKTRGKLDFAWFDYCGFFMNTEAKWSADNAHLYMHPGSDVWFTFQAIIRGRAMPYAYFTKIENETPEEKIATEIVAMGPVKTWHVRDDGSIYNVLASPSMLRALAIRRIGIRKLYPGYTFDIEHITYKDRDPKTQDDRGPGMILLHLTNIRAKYALAA